MIKARVFVLGHGQFSRLELLYSKTLGQCFRASEKVKRVSHALEPVHRQWPGTDPSLVWSADIPSASLVEGQAGLLFSQSAIGTKPHWEHVLTGSRRTQGRSALTRFGDRPYQKANEIAGSVRFSRRALYFNGLGK